MWIDSFKLPKGKTLEADVCIVGGGAAGIAIARELAKTSLSVCVIESGGFGFEEETQDLYAGEMAGGVLPPTSSYVKSSRLRYFGGSTNHWGAFLRPLDALDFETRGWVPGSGWPFGKAELEPFYDRACMVCGVPDFHFDPAKLGRLTRKPVSVGAAFSTEIFQQAWPVTRFGEVYREELRRAKNVTLVTHANLTDIRLEGGAGARAVKELAVSSLGGPAFRVSAKQYILAAGGLENARLLLQSKVGNDLVGRYFMEHPHVPVGFVCLWGGRALWDLYTGFRPDSGVSANVLGTFRLTDELQRGDKLLNTVFSLVPLSQPFDGSAKGFQADWKARVAPLFPHPEPPSPVYGARLEAHAKEAALFESIAGIASFVDDERVPFTTLLLARSEQTPNRDSRVVLSDRRDALGKPQLKLEWNLSAVDKESIVAAANRFALELGSAGLGRAQVSTTWDHLGGGCHHMGTTRMGDDPATGVVDKDCRVHGIANLHIAGSSVFPTSGCSNPTLTLVALALRLADRVKGMVRG